MDDSSLSSSSSQEDDVHKHHKKRRRKYVKRKGDDKHSNDDKQTNNVQPAQSDWEALRAHFQFVLPDETNDDVAMAPKKRSTWQDRMVEHYHSHLYKEFVLADLSRVLEIDGKIGLRWRTESEVKCGKGFRTCGNLKCKSLECVNEETFYSKEKKDAYDTAVRRSIGIGAPENDGKEPIGVVLPVLSSSKAGLALDTYLKSSVERKEDRYGHKRQRKSKKKKRKRHHKHSNSSTWQDEEREEQKRLSRVPYGVGLYDYEVDFKYIEQSISKREFVKVRLCLRCAPLLFAAKDKITSATQDDNNIGPAVRARNVRLEAAMEATRAYAKNNEEDNEKAHAK